MRFLDRLILSVIAVGIWALVLQPSALEAHDNNYHSCSGSGTGYGEPDGNEIFVYSLNLNIDCDHY